MKRNKLLLLLVLLMTAATGAWAQTETLLTTITATGTDSYSETTPGVVTVTHDNDKFDVDWGWIWRYQPGSITVEAKEGYTITKCVFSQPEKTPVTVSTAPFKVNFLYNDNEDYEKYLCVGTDPDEGIDGFTSIEVYGYGPAAIFAIDTDGTTQDFGSVEADATAQKTFTITNSGNKSLYVTISNPADFTAEMTPNDNANVYFTDALGWGDIQVYYWPNGPEWPGAAMTELYTNELGQKVYCYKLPADIEGVIFNGNGNQTGDINEPIGKAYYTKDEKVGNNYTVGTWSYNNCVPAGMSRVLTVTMNTATLGSKSGNITLSFDAKNATSFTIPCTGKTVQTYNVTLAEGTEEAENWKAKVGNGELQALPLTGLTGDGTETVTITYSGEKRVKSVKAVKVAPTYTLLSAATAEDIGKVVCAAGHLHDAKTAVPDGCTAVGILGKVTSTGHGLILALQDATSQTWNTINGWTSASYAGTTLKLLPDGARGSLTSYATLGETTVSNWAVAQKSDYDAIFTNLGSTAGDEDGKIFDGNVNAFITGAGGAALSGDYWSATESGDGFDALHYSNPYWGKEDKRAGHNVRPVLGF